MIVEELHVVTLSYDLRDTDGQGELLERTESDSPFTFLYGAGHLLPSFEANLRGLSVGDRFHFTLTPDEAYGDSIPENIVDIPMDNFRVGGEVPENILQPGNFLTMSDNFGQQHLGKVLAYTSDYVKIDFNHAMAGKTLYFEGAILRIRKASAEEVSHQHYHPQEGEYGFGHFEEDED